MSKEDLIKQRNQLNKGLKESYEKMLQLKMKLGQKVVISDCDGKPITITADQAWNEYRKSQTSGRKNAPNS